LETKFGKNNRSKKVIKKKRSRKASLFLYFR
jgi:hypothetical protein